MKRILRWTAVAAAFAFGSLLTVGALPFALFHCLNYMGRAMASGAAESAIGPLTEYAVRRQHSRMVQMGRNGGKTDMVRALGSRVTKD